MLFVDDAGASETDAEKECALVLVDFHIGVLEQPMGVACDFAAGEAAFGGLARTLRNLGGDDQDVPMLVVGHSVLLGVERPVSPVRLSLLQQQQEVKPLHPDSASRT